MDASWVAHCCMEARLLNASTLSIEAPLWLLSRVTFRSQKKNYFFHEVGFPAMGHVPKDGFEEETDLILYDGAGTRIKLGSNIGVVTPANRFQDGVTMSVSDWCELMERLTIGAEREWR